MSKIKLLFVGDIHFGARQPDSRKDDFYKTTILKVEEIVNIAKEHNVDAVLQPGDLFDTPKPPYNIIGDLVNILNPIKKFIMVPGNHEMPGNTESSLSRSALALLEGINCIEFANKENPIYIEKDGDKVAITGSRYTPNIDTTRKDFYIVNKKMADIHIHLVHGMLTEEYMGEMIYHTTIDEIIDTEADITLAGHEHLGFGIISKNKKIFINNGALQRLTCSTKEMKRIPVVTLIEIENREINIETIPLKNAQKGELVLDRSKLDDKKAKELHRARLSAIVDEEIQQLDSIAVFDLIDYMSNIESLELNIQEECKDELESIIEDLDGEKSDILSEEENVHISKIILKNFESHTYSEIECSEGLNVIVGQSNSGKSSIFKALKWVYMNEPVRGTDFITIGEKVCRVEIQLSNGYKVIREKHRESIKEKGKKKEEKINKYIIINPDGSRFWEEGEEANKFNHEKVPKEVKDILKINNMKYDSDNEINFNFLDQIKPCFFLDEKAPAKAKIMGMFYGTHYIDESIRRLTAKEKEFNKEIKIKNKELEQLDASLKKYDYLNETQIDIENLKRILKERQILINEHKGLYNLRNEYNEVEVSINENKKTVDYFNNLELKIYKHKNIFQVIDLINTLIEFDNELELLQNNKTKYSELLEFKIKIYEFIKNINKFSVNEINEIIYIYEEFINNNNLIYKNEKTISLTESIKSNEINYKNLIDKILFIPDLLQIDDEFLFITNNIKKNINIVNEKHLFNYVEKKYLEYEQINKEYEFIINNLNDYKNILKEIRNITKAFNVTSTLDKIYEKDIHISNKIKEIEKMNEEFNEYIDVYNQIKMNNIKIKENKKIINKTLKEYENVLVKIGKCPICLGDINEESINRIINEYSIKNI